MDFLLDYLHNLHKMSSTLLDIYARNGIQVKIPNLSDCADRCFFLRRELSRTKEDVKTSGHYQHLKFARNKASGQIEFLEYATSKAYFKTLEEWADLNDCTMMDVLYGRQFFDGQRTYITFYELLQQIANDVPEVDDLSRLFQKLRTNSVPINQIMIPKTIMVSGDVYLME